MGEPHQTKSLLRCEEMCRTGRLEPSKSLSLFRHAFRRDQLSLRIEENEQKEAEKELLAPNAVTKRASGQEAENNLVIDLRLGSLSELICLFPFDLS